MADRSRLGWDQRHHAEAWAQPTLTGTVFVIAIMSPCPPSAPQIGRRSRRPRTGDPAGEACCRGDPRQGAAGWFTKSRCFRSRGDRAPRQAHRRRSQLIDIELRDPTPALALSLVTEAPVTAGATASPTCTTVISLPWSARSIASVKGVVHQTEGCQADPQTRDPGRYP